ncbi:MAG: PAS domain-containing protein [Syntrophaceae bacterium]|nr:PAS domain-containing protein [Syntrophaceae bacterium]
MKIPPETDPQLYFRVVENIDRAVIALDREGRVSLFNPAAQSYTGISEKQALGRSFRDLFFGQKNLLYLVTTALSEGRSISDHEDLMLNRLNAPALPVSVSVSPLYTDAGKPEGAVLIIRNLSRVKDLEMAVRRSDRLSILGTLAAGLAHEIKNPLGGIKGATQLLAMELPGDSPLREYTEVMIREVERVNGIIEELMDLARPRPPQWSPVNLSKVLGNIVLMEKQAHQGKMIEFQMDLDPSIPPLLGDENLLTRLFLNLIKNAAEALDKKGKVTVSTKVAPDYHLTKPGSRPIPMIVIEVQDNGPGIAPEILEQIFTPFYTTKSKGSGLGLATCQKIINEHDGFLKVDSIQGEGTLFSVSLPLHTDKQSRPSRR